MTSITIALSKGRIFDETAPLLKAAGIIALDDPEKSRKLILKTNHSNVWLIIVRASDVPTYVQYGAADIGIGSFIGSGSIIKQSIKLDSHCVVSMGVAVRQDYAKNSLIFSGKK